MRVRGPALSISANSADQITTREQKPRADHHQRAEAESRSPTEAESRSADTRTHVCVCVYVCVCVCACVREWWLDIDINRVRIHQLCMIVVLQFVLSECGTSGVVRGGRLSCALHVQ